ncbi:MAG: universal stress protein [Chitinophagaceae bacterium]|nr:universal stress protein [Chitinophagaceae bacterium]
MQKIIAAFDGLKYSTSTRDHAIALARSGNMHLTGVFLDDVTYTSYKVYELITKDGVSDKKLKQLAKKDYDTRNKAVADFENACRKAGVEYNIHHDRKTALKELLHESIYADLIIIDSKETLTHYDESLPTRFIRELLTDVQCPVLLVPQKYKPIEKIALLYDGRPSSVHAVRMFSYLYPAPAAMHVEVISVKGMGNDMHLPDGKLVKEFIKNHYPKAIFKVLKGLPEIEIVKHLAQENKNVLAVLGAYRRGTVSRWFKASMADELMIELKTPLFIAHTR